MLKKKAVTERSILKKKAVAQKTTTTKAVPTKTDLLRELKDAVSVNISLNEQVKILESQVRKLQAKIKKLKRK